MKCNLRTVDSVLRTVKNLYPSPYILGATLEKHICQYEEKYPDTVNELLLNTYVDDVQSGGDGKEELLKFKEEATEIMGMDFRVDFSYTSGTAMFQKLRNRVRMNWKYLKQIQLMPSWQLELARMNQRS